MERFENANFKQREVINDRMTEIFGLLKELTTSRAPKKVLIREKIERPDGLDTEVQLNEVEKENEAENGTKNEPIKSTEKEPTQVE
ncbi:hypothetical protein Tco_0359332 [Tanacetum coccineum]